MMAIPGSPHEEARRALLPDLPAGHERALYHLLSCETCRTQIRARLKAAGIDEPAPEVLWSADRFTQAGEADPLVREALHKGREARERLAILEVDAPLGN